MTNVTAITDAPVTKGKGGNMLGATRLAISQASAYSMVNSDSFSADQVLMKSLTRVAPGSGFYGVGGSAAHG
jgi:hypothetical protein